MKTLTQTIVDELNKDINREIESNEGHIYPDTESYIEGLKRAIKMVEAHALVEKVTLKVAYQHDRPGLSHYEDGSAFETWYNETFNNEER